MRVLSWSFCNPYSNLAYRIPSYQKTAVNNFLTKHKPPFTSAQFNTSGVCTYSPGIFSSDPHIIFLFSLALSRIYRLTGTFSKFLLLIFMSKMINKCELRRWYVLSRVHWYLACSYDHEQVLTANSSLFSEPPVPHPSLDR